MWKKKRIKAYLNCLWILYLGWFWDLYDLEYINKFPLKFWKDRLYHIKNHKNFIK